VDTLTSAEKAIAARRLAAVRPVVAALVGVAAPEAFWELCRDELMGVDVIVGGWDIRARWFGVVICATPRLGELGRGITIFLARRRRADHRAAAPRRLTRFWPHLGLGAKHSSTYSMRLANQNHPRGVSSPR
jgi:hypothetical protein